MAAVARTLTLTDSELRILSEAMQLYYVGVLETGYYDLKAKRADALYRRIRFEAAAARASKGKD